MSEPDETLTRVLRGLKPGKALDLAAGKGRHAIWLAGRGWDVTAVDIEIGEMPGVQAIRADLEKHEYRIEADAWDLIMCWLYWQPDLLAEIARGVRRGGSAAIAGKTSGRFATSLGKLREAFAGWKEVASGENEIRCFLIASKEIVDQVDDLN